MGCSHAARRLVALWLFAAVCSSARGDLFYNYTLHPRHLAKGVAYEGSGAALRQVLRTLHSGGPITLSALGGSVTRGHGGPSGSGDRNTGHVGSWSRLVFDYISRRWPHKDHLYVNGAVPATGSQHFAVCLKYHVHARSDLVLLEFAVNDGGSGPSGPEGVVRRIRASATTPTGPAILFVSYHDGWFGAHGEGHGNVWTPRMFDQPEEVFTAVSQWYDLSSLSMRNALMADDLRNVSGFSFADFSSGWNHPNEVGHRMMADLVVHLLNRTSAAMERGEVPPDDDQLPPASWLPPPLVEGNTAEAVEPTCHFGQNLEQLVRHNVGWVYLPDAEKPGLQANTSGCVLDLEVGAVSRTVVISHLRSWMPDMGGANVSCVAGCECDGAQIDARSRVGSNTRVMVQHLLMVRQPAPSCTLRLQNVHLEPRDGDTGALPNGTTFKLMGISVGGVGTGGGGFLGNEVPMHMDWEMGSHQAGDALQTPRRAR